MSPPLSHSRIVSPCVSLSAGAAVVVGGRGSVGRLGRGGRGVAAIVVIVVAAGGEDDAARRQNGCESD